MKKRISVVIVAALCAITCMFCLVACGSGRDNYDASTDDSGGGSFAPAPSVKPDGDYGDYVYNSVIEQKFSSVAEKNSSYFSLDKNTANYSLIRKQLEDNQKINTDSVRIEELINYFDYDFPEPEEGKAVAATGYLSACPWNSDNKLMLVGVKSADVNLDEINSNYVFLIDVSGSMSGDNRIGLAKKGINMLVDSLGERDVVSLVTYASGVNTHLDGVECTEEGREQIKGVMNGLVAKGATRGGDGLERAYNLAQNHFISGGNNRVIIISDGDFNVGISDTAKLEKFIREKAETGVYLTVLGVGMNNTRDDMLETLANCGNGNYAYLDNETEARKVFGEELKGTLFTVAKDAKAGVTFTDNVVKYRLIGYDTKIITEEDFDNVNADTGEIGSNLCVAALYEITLAEGASGKLADIEIKYKDVRTEEEIETSVKFEVTDETPDSEDMKFIACVAECGLLLRDSEYMGEASVDSVKERLELLSDYIRKDEHKQEMVDLVYLGARIYGVGE